MFKTFLTPLRYNIYKLILNNTVCNIYKIPNTECAVQQKIPTLRVKKR